jgi:hypothetical protein
VAKDLFLFGNILLSWILPMDLLTACRVCMGTHLGTATGYRAVAWRLWNFSVGFCKVSDPQVTWADGGREAVMMNPSLFSAWPLYEHTLFEVHTNCCSPGVCGGTLLLFLFLLINVMLDSYSICSPWCYRAGQFCGVLKHCFKDLGKK